MRQFLFILSLFTSFSCFSQSFNEDKTVFANFIDDYDHQYIISVVSLEKANYTNPSTMNRVAQIKAQSQANTFFNGSTIASEIVIKTTEKKSKDSTNTIVETIESIKENATGFTKGLELLTNFDNTDSKRMVFIYYRELIKNQLK